MGSKRGVVITVAILIASVAIKLLIAKLGLSWSGKKAIK